MNPYCAHHYSGVYLSVTVIKQLCHERIFRSSYTIQISYMMILNKYVMLIGKLVLLTYHSLVIRSYRDTTQSRHRYFRCRSLVRVYKQALNTGYSQASSPQTPPIHLRTNFIMTEQFTLYTAKVFVYNITNSIKWRSDLLTCSIYRSAPTLTG